MSSASEALVPILLLLALQQRPQAEEGTERERELTQVPRPCVARLLKNGSGSKSEARSQDTFLEDPGR